MRDRPCRLYISQDIRPQTDWFGQYIRGSSGNAGVERIAFSLASYGKQLGLITEVLLAIAEQSADLSAEAKQSLERLQKIKLAIDSLKPTVEK